MIEQSIDDGEAYRIVLDGKKVGGVVIKVEGEKGDLDLLFAGYIRCIRQTRNRLE